MNPTCSIIIPAYNVAAYLAEAIDSALAQGHPRCEVIVVDDGSTDTTPDIIRSYGTRIVAVTQSNRGLAGARNAGIRVATGEYIGLLDADDIWEVERVARCIELLERDPGVGIVTTDAYLLRDRQRTADRFYGDYNPREFPAPDQQLREIATRNFLWVSAVVRRSVVTSVGEFDERLRRSEDYDYWIRCLLSGARVALIREPLGWYRLRADSLSANTTAQWEAHLSVLERRLPALWDATIRADAPVYFEIARGAAQERRVRDAARFALMGLRISGYPLARRVRATARVARCLVESRSRAAPTAVSI